jgi:hypothetical protein
MNCIEARRLIRSFREIKGLDMSEKQIQAWQSVCKEKKKCPFCRRTYQIALEIEKSLLII